MVSSLLIVDDEPSLVESLVRIFESEPVDAVHVAASAEQALKMLQKGADAGMAFDVVLTDLRMAQLNGLDLLKTIRLEYPHTEVILMTAYGTVEYAVEAMREGAYDFITKPFRRAVVTRAVKRALEKRALMTENAALRQALQAKQTTPLLGTAPIFRRAMTMAEQVAYADATVLISGESGTGKELFARHIYQCSARVNQPFIAINCAALPESLIESELFGYEKGAFTGANQKKPGCFMRAHGGTLFLDEIGEIPFNMQAKLLRALENGEIQPLGGATQKVDVRLIAATKHQLEQAVQSGRFREDLYYRLNVVPIKLPSLRERREDILLLAQAFIGKFERQFVKKPLALSLQARLTLQNYDFPGNVRELEHAMERAVLLTQGETIERTDLPEAMLGALPQAQADGQPEANSKGAYVFPFGTTLEEMERRAICETLERMQGNKEKVAKTLGISLRTIYRKLGEPEPAVI